MLKYPSKTTIEKVHAYKDNYEFGNYKCYFRFYYRCIWIGRYLDTENVDSSFIDRVHPCIVKFYGYLEEKYKDGCDYYMEDVLKETAYKCPNGRYLLEYEEDNFHFLVEFATEYGNEDYPVRVYIYEKEI